MKMNLVKITVTPPAAGPTLRTAFKVFSGLGKRDGTDVFLIGKVFLCDENGEVISETLDIVVRVDSDGDHLGLLGLQQLLLCLNIVLPTPRVELALAAPDLVPVVSGLAFVPEERRDC